MTADSASSQGDFDFAMDVCMRACGNDPLREARIYSGLAERSEERGDVDRAIHQSEIALSWEAVYRHARERGLPLRGESSPHAEAV